MSEKHKKGIRALNCLEHFLAFVSAVSGCVSFSGFVLLVGVLVGYCKFCSRNKNLCKHCRN